MADENHGHGGGNDAKSVALWFLGGLAILLAVWVYTGGPSRSSLKGIFLNPLPPVGSGDSYGPQIGTTTNQH